ncbi:MAG: type II toxin-antitoxin system VapC family toxin [Salinarimonas sp.]
MTPQTPTTSIPAFSDGTRVYLDANVLIELVERWDAGLGRIVEDARAGRLLLVTSELTLAEVIVMPLRDGDAGLLAQYRDLFSQPELIACLPITRDVIERSGEIRATDGGKLADAIHLATAEIGGCKVFLSSDRRIRPRAPMVRIGIERIADDT